MNRYHRPGVWIIWLSFFIALILQIMPWPQHLCRPSWINLLLIYWVMALPHRMNVGTGFIVGMIIDLLLGSTLGLRALALSILAYLVGLKCYFFNNVTLFIQAMIVILLSFTTQMSVFLVEFLFMPIMNISFLPEILWNSAIDGCLWPWVFLLMRNMRCQFDVQ